MLNLFQHLTKSWTYETLKQVQGDRLGLFTSPSKHDKKVKGSRLEVGGNKNKKRVFSLKPCTSNLKRFFC